MKAFDEGIRAENHRFVARPADDRRVISRRYLDRCRLGSDGGDESSNSIELRTGLHPPRLQAHSPYRQIARAYSAGAGGEPRGAGRTKRYGWATLEESMIRDRASGIRSGSSEAEWPTGSGASRAETPER